MNGSSGVSLNVVVKRPVCSSRCTSPTSFKFTPSPDGTTLVELEHRCFERQGDGGVTMRTQVDLPGGWGQLMERFKSAAEDQA